MIAELSRITDELPDMIRWRVGRPAPYGDTSTFAALADVVRSEAGILELRRPRGCGERIDVHVRVLGRRSRTESVAAWRRISSPWSPGRSPSGDTSRDEAFSAWRPSWTGSAPENPTIIAFEDMHAASEPSLAFLESLLDAERASALLIVVAARPELFDLRPGWGGDPGGDDRWPEPLSDAELTGQLVRPCRRSAHARSGARRTVVERAGGNPLYAEEFVRMLNERARRGRPRRRERACRRRSKACWRPASMRMPAD